MRIKRIRSFLAPLLIVAMTGFAPQRANADMFGGDVAVLIQILTNAIQQLAQLRQIFQTGEDTLGLLRDINRGIRDGLAIIQIVNPKFNPGIYSNLNDADRALSAIESLYGRVPQTAAARLQASQDQSVAESLSMHGSLYSYADSVDREAQNMLAHSKTVNPQGAAKLQAQSLAVLIGVMTQLLRTNSTMMKMMAQNMALQNRKEKIGSEQFRQEYQGLSEAFGSLPKTTKLPSVGN